MARSRISLLLLCLVAAQVDRRGVSGHGGGFGRRGSEGGSFFLGFLNPGARSCCCLWFCLPFAELRMHFELLLPSHRRWSRWSPIREVGREEHPSWKKKTVGNRCWNLWIDLNANHYQADAESSVGGTIMIWISMKRDGLRKKGLLCERICIEMNNSPFNICLNTSERVVVHQFRLFIQQRANQQRPFWLIWVQRRDSSSSMSRTPMPPVGLHPQIKSSALHPEKAKL